MSSSVHTVEDRFVRPAGAATIAGGLVIIVLGLIDAVGFDIGAAWFAIAAVGLAGIVAGLIAVRRTGATGPGGVGRMALVLGIVAMAVFALSHVVETVIPDSAVASFFLGQTIFSLALFVAGIAVVRAGRWAGWRRFTPLVCGLYPLVVMTPVFVFVGHGLPASFVAIAGWGACWLLLGIALRTRSSNPEGEHA